MSQQELEKSLSYNQHENFSSDPAVVHKFPKSLNKFKRFYIRRKRFVVLIVSFLIGQALAILNAITGVCSTIMANYNLSAPLTQNLPHTGLLALTFGQAMVFRQCKTQCSDSSSQSSYNSQSVFLRDNWWKYLLASLFDVHSNWSMVAAYKYTNMVSIQVLDCCAICSAMLLSRIIFKIRYTLIHYLAVIGCFIGIIILILSDIFYSNSSSEFKFNHRILLGDSLALIGAFMYGANNVIQQHLTQRNGSTPFLGYTSIVSTILLVIYCSCMEYTNIQDLIRNFDHIQSRYKWSFLGYVLSMYFLYCSLSFGLKYTNAVFVNLSFLTVDIYTLIIGSFVFGEKFIWLYILALVIIISCALLFIVKEPKRIEANS